MKYMISIVLILITHCTLAFAHPSQTNKFITIADIHFNPFIGCDQLSSPCPIMRELRTTNPQSWDLVFKKYSNNIQTRSHQDTDYTLLQSTLNELKILTQEQHPHFILILGDFLAHKFPEKFKKYTGNDSAIDYQAFTKKTLQYLAYKFNQAAPDTTLYPVLGNNDSYNGNYNINLKGQFLKDTADIFSAFIKNENALQEFKQEYQNAGYYAVTLDQSNHRLIVLNTVLFSMLHFTPAQKKAANLQLNWLQEQLNNARIHKQRVFIALHIPPGIDVFLSSKMRFDFIRYLVHPLFFSSEINKNTISLLKEYSDVVVGLLPAHTHHDTFQLIAGNTNKQFIPSSLTPSISPIYGNNPGFKIFSYDEKTSELTNADTYFYRLRDGKSAKWKKEYNFNDVYQPGCKQCKLVNGILNLKKGGLLIDAYNKYFAVSLSTPLTNASMLDYWCGIYNIDWMSYKACLATINQ